MPQARKVEKENRGYSLISDITVSKAVSADGSEVVTITGIASTPTPDRMGDIVDPMGAQFTTPMPLLWQHDHTAPVGRVTSARPTKKGIAFTAELPIIETPGTLKDRIDEAIQSVKLGLVAAVSIGFSCIQGAVEYVEQTGGLLFKEWDWYELSLVTVPANAEATIATVKSIDRQHLLAHQGVVKANAGDQQTHGNADPSPRGQKAAANGGVKALLGDQGTKMNYQKQIEAFQNTRAAKVGAMEKLMSDAAEKGETLTVDQEKEYDDLREEVKKIDSHLQRLDEQAKIAVQRAAPVGGESANDGANSRGGAAAQATRYPNVMGLERKLEPGHAFARFAICVARSFDLSKNGNHVTAESVAKSLYPDMPSMANVFKSAEAFGGVANWVREKAAVIGANTSDASNAGPLLAYNTWAGDFRDFLRPASIVGKFGTAGIPSLRQAPFNVHIKGASSGGTGYWVGEGNPKPVTAFGFNDVYLGWNKVAGITVLTQELMRFSNPGAEALVRDMLRDAIVARMDTTFIDPAAAAVSGVSPASITNGVTPIAASGTTAADLRVDLTAALAPLVAANIPLTSIVYVMDAMSALRISMLRTTLESTKEFPDMTINGGLIDGVPVIVSNYVPVATAGGHIFIVSAQDVYLADDGDVTIDASTEASIQMLDNPTNSTLTGTATSVVSMFQTNSVALRAERFVNWAKRRTQAVQAISGVNYGS